MNNTKSKKLYEEAKKYIPGGVNSPVRAFNSVGAYPVFAKSAYGAKLWDVDDNEYIDYICSWGPLILGHSSNIASNGVLEILNTGTTFGIPTEIEICLAKEIVESYEAVELVRMVSSGTEATMSAIRVARGFTRKNKIVKFQGCYHGHSDGLLVKSGSGALSNGVPTSEGVPKAIIDETIVAEFNNISNIEEIFEKYGNDIACVIIEPIAGNMGLVQAKIEFLQIIRELCDKYNSILIFDEVISGFRIAYGGAASYYGIQPDMACFGKIIGGGMPVGAYGGKKEIMELISPIGGVYQAGTLSGNPLSMQMGLNVITHLKNNKNIYVELEEKAKKLEKGFNMNLQSLAMENICVNRAGGMLCQFFTKSPVNSYNEVMQSDTEKYAVYFREMLERGILLPPAQFECMFLSTEHSNTFIDLTIKAHYESIKVVKEI